MHHFTIIAIKRGFSRSNENTDWEISFDETLSDDVTVRWILPKLYANGNCKDNKGYVSIIFPENDIFRSVSDGIFDDLEIRCYASVVDVAGEKRFTQSRVYLSRDHDICFQLCLEKYLKRDTLLNDPDELLPGDCLTVILDLDFIPVNQIGTLYDLITKSPANRNRKGSHKQKSEPSYIHLDTDFGRELCRVSDYFWSASHTTMIEGRTRKVRIPKEERRAFHYMPRIFKKREKLKFRSIDDIIELYVVADKYNIPLVIESCRQLIKGFLRATADPDIMLHTAEIVPEILELAVNYRDGDLKVTVCTYMESIINCGTDLHALLKLLNEKLET